MSDLKYYELAEVRGGWEKYLRKQMDNPEPFAIHLLRGLLMTAIVSVVVLMFCSDNVDNVKAISAIAVLIVGLFTLRDWGIRYPRALSNDDQKVEDAIAELKQLGFTLKRGEFKSTRPVCPSNSYRADWLLRHSRDTAEEFETHYNNNFSAFRSEIKSCLAGEREARDNLLAPSKLNHIQTELQR